MKINIKIEFEENEDSYTSFIKIKRGSGKVSTTSNKGGKVNKHKGHQQSIRKAGVR